MKVAIPSTPADAKGLLAAAIRDPDPVVVLEPKLIYRLARGDVPEGEHVVPLGKARVAREGSDVTIVAYGAMVDVAQRVAESLDGGVVRGTGSALAQAVGRGQPARIGCQDRPCGRRPGGATVCGFASEVAILAEKAIRPSRARAPCHGLRRAVPVCTGQLEDAYVPSEARVADAVRRVLAT